MTSMAESGPGRGHDVRDAAAKRLRKRRDFRGHLLVYLLVNSAVVLVWAMTGPHGFFWPAFLMVFWGIGVVMNGWDVYVGGDISEEAIDREVERMQHH
jgi:hypothetical protein